MISDEKIIRPLEKYLFITILKAEEIRLKI